MRKRCWMCGEELVVDEWCWECSTEQPAPRDIVDEQQAQPIDKLIALEEEALEEVAAD